MLSVTQPQNTQLTAGMLAKYPQDAAYTIDQELFEQARGLCKSFCVPTTGVDTNQPVIPYGCKTIFLSRYYRMKDLFPSTVSLSAQSALASASPAAYPSLYIRINDPQDIVFNTQITAEFTVKIRFYARWTEKRYFKNL